MSIKIPKKIDEKVMLRILNFFAQDGNGGSQQIVILVGGHIGHNAKT